jgi:predicted O-methyltransferase YrrM
MAKSPPVSLVDDIRLGSGRSTGYKDIDFSNLEEFEAEVLDKIKVDLNEALMSSREMFFLNGLIRKTKPKRILELGVNKGGSSALILNAISDIPGSMLYSVDKHRNPLIGILVKEKFSKLTNKWRLSTGNIACYFLDEMTNNGKEKFDLCFIDTMHLNPGEFLDILQVLPYLKKNAIVVLHDTAIYMGKAEVMADEANQRYWRDGYTCRVLLNTLRGRMFHSTADYIFPNIGGVVLDDDVEGMVKALFYNLTLEWVYMPPNLDLLKTLHFFKRFYPPHYVSVYYKAARHFGEVLKLKHDQKVATGDNT